MKYANVCLTLLMATGASSSFAAVLPGAWWTAEQETCTTDPATGSSYKCYNPNWAKDSDTVYGLADVALEIGRHLGESDKKNYNNTGTPEIHCYQDMLANNIQAANRILWSLKCEYITYEQAISSMLRLGRGGLATVKPILQYPVYGLSPKELYGSLPRDTNYKDFSCDSLPINQLRTGWCDAGCFKGDQTFTFKINGEEDVGDFESQAGKKLDIRALDQSSKLDQIKTKYVKADIVEMPVASETGAEIMLISTSDFDSNELKVTPNHPLVNGEGMILDADKVREGDELLTIHGPVTVRSIKRVLAPGSVYNVLPESTESHDNIVIVGNGFLVGSKRLQRAELVMSNRLFARENIKID